MGLKQTLTIKEFLVRKCSPHSLQMGKIKIVDHSYFPEKVPMLSFLYLLSLPQPEKATHTYRVNKIKGEIFSSRRDKCSG